MEEVFSSAFYDPTKKSVIGRAKIKNSGADMVDTYILEMQVRPKGLLPLAFVSDQLACDSDHPENVHKEFRLSAGEQETIELEVSETVLDEGEYDVYFMTRHKCFKDLTQEQIDNYDSYQRVPPYKNSNKVATVTIGNPDSGNINYWYFGLSVVAIVAGIIVAGIGLFPIGIPIFIVGVITLIAQLIW